MPIVYEFAIKNFTVQSGYIEFQVSDGELELGAPPTRELAALIEQYGGKLKEPEEEKPEPFETQKLAPPTKKRAREAD